MVAWGGAYGLAYGVRLLDAVLDCPSSGLAGQGRPRQGTPDGVRRVPGKVLN